MVEFPADAASLRSPLLDEGFSCLPAGFRPLFTTTNKDARTHRNRKKRHLHHPVAESRLDCPSSHFCHVYHAYRLEGCLLVGYGHCCPHSCPLGDPHPTATCHRNSEQRCLDAEGYYCRRSYLTDETLRIFQNHVDENFQATCCPLHCPSGTLAMNSGHCIPVAKFGEACWLGEQCPQTAVCFQGLRRGTAVPHKGVIRFLKPQKGVTVKSGR